MQPEELEQMQPDELEANFQLLDDLSKDIFWLYFLYQETRGAFGADPNKAGSQLHLRISQQLKENCGSHYRFNRRAKLVVNYVKAFGKGKNADRQVILFG